MILKRKRLGFGILLLVALTPVWGDEEDKEVGHHHEHDLIEEIVVHAHMFGGGERAQNVKILYSEELERMVKTSIGETLGSTPRCTLFVFRSLGWPACDQRPW